MNESKVYTLGIDASPAANSLSALKNQVAQLEAAIADTDFGSKEFEDLSKKLIKARDEVKKLDKQLEGLDPEQKAKAFGEFGAAVGSSFLAATTVIQGFAGETEDAQKRIEQINQALLIVAAAQQAVEGSVKARIVARVLTQKLADAQTLIGIKLQTAYNATLGRLVTLLGLDTVARKASAAATVVQNGAQSLFNATLGRFPVVVAASTAAVKLLSGGLRILRVALISTGIGAVVVLIGSLIAYLATLEGGVNKARRFLSGLVGAVKPIISVLADVGRAIVQLVTLDFAEFKEAASAAREKFRNLGEEISRGFEDGLESFDKKQAAKNLVATEARLQARREAYKAVLDAQLGDERLNAEQRLKLLKDQQAVERSLLVSQIQVIQAAQSAGIATQEQLIELIKLQGQYQALLITQEQALFKATEAAEAYRRELEAARRPIAEFTEQLRPAVEEVTKLGDIKPPQLTPLGKRVAENFGQAFRDGLREGKSIVESALDGLFTELGFSAEELPALKAAAQQLAQVFTSNLSLAFQTAQVQIDARLQALADEVLRLTDQLDEVREREAEILQQLEGASGNRRDKLLNDLERERQARADISTNLKEQKKREADLQKERDKIAQRQAAIEAAAAQAAAIATQVQIGLAITRQASIPFPANIAAIAATIAAIQLGTRALANVIAGNRGFAEGGYTGTGGPKDGTGLSVQGVVHGGEWVSPPWQVSDPIDGPVVAYLEQRRVARTNAPAAGLFAAGGTVPGGSGSAVTTDQMQAMFDQLGRRIESMKVYAAWTEARDVADRVNFVESRSGL